MKAALDAGSNLWNGGELYGTQEYNSLHLLNHYFTKHPDDADKVVISIKGGLTPPSMVPDGSEKNVRRSVDECLKQLDGKKFLDIFECARVDPKTPIETTIAVLATYVKEGKLGGISLSEVKADTIRRAAKVHKIVAVELELSLFSPEILTNGTAAACAELGIPIVAYSPLGRGVLTGQLKSLKDIPEGDVRRHLPRFQDDTFDKNMQLVQEVEKLAAKKGCTPGQIALSWVRTLSGKSGMPVLVPIPHSSNEARILENIKEVALTDQDMKELRDILDRTQVVGERYGGPGAALMNG